jgi:hypothetical protein
LNAPATIDEGESARAMGMSAGQPDETRQGIDHRATADAALNDVRAV